MRYYVRGTHIIDSHRVDRLELEQVADLLNTYLDNLEESYIKGYGDGGTDVTEDWEIHGDYEEVHDAGAELGYDEGYVDGYQAGFGDAPLYPCI